MTQTTQILDHLKAHRTITPREASTLYYCMRLSARIHDLRRMGHKIRTVMIKGVNRNGEPIRYAQYTLEEDAA